MGVIRYLLRKTGYDVVRMSPNVPAVQRTWALSKLPNDAGPLSRPFIQNGWVFGCVDSIMKRTGMVPFQQRDGGTDSKAMTEGDLVDFFEHPNQFWSATRLWEATAANLMLKGNCLWILDRTLPTQIPIEAWAFNQDRFEAVWAKDRMEIVRWIFHPTADNWKKTINLLPCQVIWFSLFPAGDTMWGTAPLEAAMKAVEQHWIASAFVRAFFKNGASPGGVLSIKEEVGDVEFESYRKRFEDRHVGFDPSGELKALKTLVLKGEVEYTPLTISFEALQFIELMDDARKQILAIFRVPPSEISLYEQIQKATAPETFKMYFQGTIMPIHKLMEETLISQFYIPLRGANGVPARCEGRFDYANIEMLQDDYTVKIERADKTWRMGVPFNLINTVLKLGYPKIEGGDVGYVPVNLRPIDVPFTQPGAPLPGNNVLDPSMDPNEPDPNPPPAEKKPKAPPVPDENADDGPPAKSSTSAGVERGFQTLTPNSPEHRAHVLAVSKAWQKSEQSFTSRLRNYLWKAKIWILAAFRKGAAAKGGLAGVTEAEITLPLSFDKDLERIARSVFESITIEIRPVIDAELAKLGIAYRYDPTSRGIVEFLEAKVSKVVENINGIRLRGAVRRALLQAQQEGLEVEKVADLLVDVVRGNRARALTIARTEIAQVVNGVEYESYAAAGVEKVQWITSMDERVRDTHNYNMAIGPFPMGATFPNGCKFPGDIDGPPEEVINCRCSLAPVYERTP